MYASRTQQSVFLVTLSFILTSVSIAIRAAALGLSSKDLSRNIQDFVPRSLHLDGKHTICTEPTVILRRDLQYQLRFYQAYGTLVPTALAAHDLKRFFDSVTYHATITWPATETEQHLITMTLGHLQLTMSSLTSPIPWDLVAVVAHNLSKSAIRSRAEIFDAFFDDVFSSNTIGISLRLRRSMVQVSPRRARQWTSISKSHIARSKRGFVSSPRALPSPRRTMLKMTDFTNIAAMVPSVIAASRLHDFYSILAIKIETGQFDSWMPDKTIRFPMWEFELSFTSQQINVPLKFAQYFMIDMAEVSSRGFSGLYEAIVEGEGALDGLLFFVKMTKRPRDPWS